MAGERTVARHVLSAMRLYGTLLAGTCLVVAIILALQSFPTTDSYYTFVQEGVRTIFSR